MEEKIKDLHLKEDFDFLDNISIKEDYGTRFLYDNIWYNGIVYLYFSTGELKIIMNFKDGLINGEYLEYYKNGNIKEKGNYISGEINGKYIENYRKGNIKRVSYYDKGKLNGIQQEYYDKSSRIYREIEYNYDVPVNQEKIYYENGNILSVINYRNGKKNGISKEYYDNGILQNSFNYYDDDLNGSYIEYYEDGNTKTEGEFLNDKMEGKWIYYYKNGDKEILNFSKDIFIISMYVASDKKVENEVKSDRVDEINTNLFPERIKDIKNENIENSINGITKEISDERKEKYKPSKNFYKINTWTILEMQKGSETKGSIFPIEKFQEKIKILELFEKKRLLKNIEWFYEEPLPYYRLSFEGRGVYVNKNEIVEIFREILKNY